MTGGVIIAFRWLIENAQLLLTPVTGPEAFEWLSWPYRLGLPIAGGLLIGVIFQRASLGSRQVGVVHVMERLAYHSGRMPWRNAVMQFFGAALSIMSGHSVGREGPVIHVGAASSSLLGQWLGFPNNSIRVLVACGVASSIATSFNTPIAGVIFAMEVVLMEYTLVGFTPVILAAVAATSLTRVVYGSAPAFDIPIMQMSSLWELPYILLVGVVLGAAAALFIYGIRFVDERCRDLPLWIQTGAAGVITGLCALIAPEIMGIGYDTVELTLLGEIALGALVLVAVMKLIAPIACISPGLPGGLIGPTIVVGAAAGGALGVVGARLGAGDELQRSLLRHARHGSDDWRRAAGAAGGVDGRARAHREFEQHSSRHVRHVTATLTSRVVFRQQSVFVSMLKARWLDYRFDPVAVSLGRTGVRAIMDRRLLALPRYLNPRSMPGVKEEPQWVLIVENGRVCGVVRWHALDSFLEEASADSDRGEALDLLQIHGAHEEFHVVHLHATLAEALDGMQTRGAGVALVAGSDMATPGNVRGVLTKDRIEAGVRIRL